VLANYWRSINCATTQRYIPKHITKGETKMTENEIWDSQTNQPYDHGAVMSLRNAVLEMCGIEHDATYLLCAYLQQAVSPQMFERITKIVKMSDKEVVEYFGLNKPQTETREQ
jgi:hypothetical protein